MDKIDMLWIRACKSMYPETRLKSVYRRFYLSAPLDNKDLCVILMRICRSFYPVDADKFINNMLPAYMNPVQPYWDIVSQILIGHIRFSHIEKWQHTGIVWPTCQIKKIENFKKDIAGQG